MLHRGMLVGLLTVTACVSTRGRTAPPSAPQEAPVALAPAPKPAPEPEPRVVSPPERRAPQDPASEEAPKPPPPDEPRVMAPGGPPLEIARRVRTGVQPKSIAMSPRGDRLYVCNFGHARRRNVWVYDAQTLDRLGFIEFRGNAAEATVSADGATVYVSNFARARIEVVDAQTLQVTDEIEVDNNPKFMVIDQQRQLLYVSNWSSRTVSAVDLEDKRVDHTLWTGRRPRGLALQSDGTLLVGAMWDHVVQVYEPGSTRPDREFAACENPRHLMLSPDQSRLYVSCSGDWLLRWFDPDTGEVLGESPTGNNPRTIGLSEDGRFVAIADFSGSTVSLVDLTAMHHRTHAVARTKQIVGLAVAPGDDLRIFVTSWLTNELLELRPAPTGVPAQA